MNPRIRELAEQADLYARSDNSSMLFENFQKRYTQKFAELVIEETHYVTVVRGVDDLDDVMKHFGFEQ